MEGAIKKISVWCVVITFAFLLGVLFNALVKIHFGYSELLNAVVINTNDDKYLYPGVTWQNEAGSCGKPQKSMFGEEYVVIDNPLCRYSFNLQEIPTIRYDEIAKHRKDYDRKIIRLKGRFFMNPKASYPHDSRFFMISEESGNEMPIEFNSPWNFDVTDKLRNFIETKSPETNSANVSIIIEFLDVSDNPDILSISNGNPMHLLLLHIEEMNPVTAKANKKRDL